MSNDILDAKLEKTFAMIDVNKDGRIDRSDYEAKAQRALQAFGEPTTSPKGKRVVEAYLSEWDRDLTLAKSAGVGKDGSLTLDEFKQVADQLMSATGDMGGNGKHQPIMAALVDLADKNGDGVLDREEFKTVSQAIGVGGKDAESAFRALDANGDGFLSAEEIGAAWHDYYTEEESTTEPPLLGSVL